MAKETNSDSRYDFSSTDLLVYIWNKKLPLIIISILAFVGSAIISLTIDEKYTSTAIIFPSTNTSVSQNLLSGDWNRRYIYELGYEKEAEQMMQILNSDYIRDRIIDKFNLMEHYEIKPDSKFPRTELYNSYGSNVNISLTEYLSIQIEVVDKDPEMAAAITNEIVDLADTVFNDMIAQVAREGLVLVEEELGIAREELQTLNDSLDKIREMGINTVDAQTERLYEALGNAIVEGNTSAKREIEEMLRKISKYGTRYNVLNGMINSQIGRVVQLEQRRKETKFELEQDVPRKFVVDRAKVAEKKSYPKRSVIVIISTIAAFFLGLIVIILVDNIKSRKAA